MILITGATGTNGSRILKLLQAAGVPARALVRNRAKAEAIAGPGVEIVEGDMERPGTLGGALAGVDTAFLLTAPGPHGGDQERGFIDAAKSAGVRRVVMFSAMNAAASAGPRFYRMHGESEEHLKQSGLAFTILKPNSFMQNFLGMAATIGQGSLYAPLGDARISFVDVRDVTAVAAKVLTQSGYEGKSLTITGPEALTQSEIADKLSRALGIPVRYASITPEAFVQGMVAAGISQWQADAIGELYASWAQGEGAVVTDTIEQIARKKPFTFDEFARDFAADLKV